MLLFLVDVTLDDPAESYHTLREEIMKYDPKLLERPSVVALTKCDLLPGGVQGVGEDLLSFHANVFPVSSVTKEGLNRLVSELVRIVTTQ